MLSREERPALWPLLVLAVLSLTALLVIATHNEADAYTDPECRATGTPVADRPWIKIANFEWHEPSHNPMVPDNTPGYWQPDWLNSSNNVQWRSPMHILREGTPSEQRWRDREVGYYRISRTPDWEHGSVVIDADGRVLNAPPGEDIRASLKVTKRSDTTYEDGDGRPARLDGYWLYALRDRLQDATTNYIFTIQSSTCADGPWSRPLELQYGVP